MSSESEAATMGGESNQSLKSLGRYVIERKLGQGGMGAVYLARHADLKKLVALKVLPRDKAQNPTLVRRFKAEAQAAAHLEHPNIVAVYDTGEADGFLYITMEYVDGIDMFEYLKRRKTVPVKRSIDIIKQTASALQHAFKQNIVHRDIKPSNLMLRRDGTVKLADLGLARSIDETLETNITRAGTTVGTVDYMSPEQARNSKAADIRSDIYSLGCTWYQMLTGVPPFPEGSMMNKLAAHSVKPLPDPRVLNETVPEGIFAILQRMTAKKPEDRYQTPEELIEDINRSKLTRAAFSDEILRNLEDEEDGSGDSRGETLEMEEGDGDQDLEISSRQANRSRQETRLDDAVPRERKRKKTLPEVDETHVPETTQPARPRARAPLSEEASDEELTPNRIARNTQPPSVNKPTTGILAPRSKGALKPDDEEPSPAFSAKKKPSGTHEIEKLQRGASKPLPPKRAALTPVEEPQKKKLDPESIKRFGLIGAVIGLVCLLGSVLFYSERQFEVSNNPSPPVVPYSPAPPPPVQAPQQPAAPQVAQNPGNPVATQVGEVDLTKLPLPAWAASDVPLPKDLPTFQVGTGVTSAMSFSDLNEALRAVTSKGAVILLHGSGAFPLTGVELKSIKKLVIAAARPDDQPLIMIKPAAGSGTLGLALVGGELDLRGLHFVLSDGASSAAGTHAIVSVTEGQLYVRSCSFTGMTTTGIAALKFVGSLDSVSTIRPTAADDEGAVLINRTVVRGNGLIGLQIQRAPVNLVMQDSLFVTGLAPAMEVSGNVNEALLSRLRRTMRVLRSTLSSRQELLDFQADMSSPTPPPRTSVLFQDSVCSAEGSGADRILLEAAHWPSNRSNPNGWLTNLSWTNLSSLYLGFEDLVNLDSSFQVTDAETWQRLWGGKRIDSNQFQRLLWQESVIANLAAIQPADFDTTNLPFHDVKASSGGLPGCNVTRVKVPREISQSRLSALSQRAKYPAASTREPDLSLSRKVDLTKGSSDLGTILNSPDWPSGTVFEVFGFGSRAMSPVKIADKSVRIVFRQLEGTAALKIQPKSMESKSRGENIALFQIENGSLELHSAVIESTAGKNVPPWLISAKNSTVIIRNSQLSSSLQQDVENHQGLIQWTTAGSSPPAEGTPPPVLCISDSWLISTGIGVKAELAHGDVFLRNSVLAVRGYGLSIVPANTDNVSPPSLDVEHVTISASKAAVRIENPTVSGVIGAPVRMYLENNAVVPALEFKEGEAANAAVVEFAGPGLEEKHVEWWGNANGFAAELRTVLRRPNAEPVNTATAWQSIWGDSSETRLLTGPKGVQLQRPLPSKWSSLKLNSFALDPESQSAKWAEGGRQIGADIPVLEEALVLKRVAKESKFGSSPNKKPMGQGNGPQF